MINKLQAVILAAGKSSRFKTNRSKLLEKICGQEMILYPIRLFHKLKLKTSLVVGHQKDKLISLINNNNYPVIFSEQKEQLGTGHAIMCSKDSWEKENILIINGDTPLITEELITDLYNTHIKNKSTISFVTAHNIDPSLNSYGKVLKNKDHIRILEAKDYKKLKEENKLKDLKDYECCCINAGIYIIKKDFLNKALTKLKKSSATGELYITDLIKHASDNKLGVSTVISQIDAIRGINTLRELWIAEQIKRAEIITNWMNAGVRFDSAQNSHIDLNVTINPGVKIGSDVQIYGKSTIGKNTTIESFCIIKDSHIPDNSYIKAMCYLENTTLTKTAKLEPFTHLNKNISSNSIKTSSINLNSKSTKSSPKLNSKEDNTSNFVAAKKTDNIYPS